MIVIGIDPHMKTHTAVALDGATGTFVGELTVTCDAAGHDRLLSWPADSGRAVPLRSRTAGTSRADSNAICSAEASAWCASRPR